MDAGLLQDIVAVEQMLRIGHHGDGHHFAIDGDQLGFVDLFAIFFDIRIEWPDQPVSQHRQNGAVGDNCRSILGWISFESSNLKALMFFRLVFGDANGAARAFLGFPHHIMQRWKIIRKDPYRTLFNAAAGKCISRTGHNHNARQNVSCKKTHVSPPF